MGVAYRWECHGPHKANAPVIVHGGDSCDKWQERKEADDAAKS
jgi:hypothetical protein